MSTDMVERAESIRAPSATTATGKDNPELLKRSLEFQTRLNELMQHLHATGTFTDIMPAIEASLLVLLDCERITIYQRPRTQPEIISKYKSGDDIHEIRVPLSTTSIAGYVALSQRPVRIDDVYIGESLKAIHPDLRFDSSYDRNSGFRSRSMIVIPIKHKDVLLGVMQILNKRGGDRFTNTDMINAMRIAKILGQKFRYDLGGTDGPFDYLVYTQKISQDELEEFKERAKREKTSITQLLVNETTLSPFEIGSSLERYYQVPFMAYDPDIQVPTELLKGLNETYLRKQLWVPVEGDRSEVTVLIDDPSDTQRIMEIQRVLMSRNYAFKVGLPDDIRKFLGFGGGEEGTADLSELVGQLEEESIEEEATQVGEGVDENEATVIKLVNSLIIDAYKARASDIHIEPAKGRQPATVRLRIDGVCQRSLTIPSTHIRAVVSRIKVMSRLDIAERRLPQDGKLVIRYRGQPLELRVATIPTVNGESVVMRILSTSKPLPLDKLNLSERNEKETKELVAHPHGIFLVVGPTGSGKTTTLHAVLGHINSPERKIWTAEDPVEITQPGLQQVQVKPKIGFNFAAALRSFLRADPDVIMIGEMRDAETASSGVEASLTGHLVFSTLHTNSASETVVRLLDLGIDPISFSDALLGVLAQRLVRTLCEDCKEAYQPDEKEFNLIRRYYGEEYFAELGVNRDNLTLYRAAGCDACGKTGYRGRTGVHELLVATPTIKELIYRKASASELKALATREGLRSLMQDGIAKLVRGQMDLDQIRRVAAE